MEGPVAPIYVGTSGFSYPEWKPSFYPHGLPPKAFLSHYATRLSAVEIDSTFYRMPKPATLDSWRQATGEGFRFACKAPQGITHRERLALPSPAFEYWNTLLPRLGSQLGVVLYQLPPSWRRDDERLGSFLAALPSEHAAAFEFRNPSWFAPEVLTLLRERGVALCINDGDGGTTPIEITAPRTYLRLRRASYDATTRRVWLERVLAWSEQGLEVFLFVKHEDNPGAPLVAVELLEELEVLRRAGQI